VSIDDQTQRGASASSSDGAYSGGSAEDQARHARFGTVMAVIAAVLAAAGIAVAVWAYVKPPRPPEQPHSALTFTEPAPTGQECTRVSREGLEVRGAAQLHAPETVWLLVQAPGEGRLYVTAQKPLDVIDGNWSQAVTSIGSVGSDDVGHQFALVAVAANLTADTQIRAALNASSPAGVALERLPDGAVEIARLCLQRT
jgi:hypothetical protein